jgi:hypothetical protein
MAIGDAMNLAGRLKSLNKTYGASEAVRTAAAYSLEWRRLDRITVVGRRQSMLGFVWLVSYPKTLLTVGCDDDSGGPDRPWFVHGSKADIQVKASADN